MKVNWIAQHIFKVQGNVLFNNSLLLPFPYLQLPQEKQISITAHATMLGWLELFHYSGSCSM
jgi:hypothetical protein